MNWVKNNYIRQLNARLRCAIFAVLPLQADVVSLVRSLGLPAVRCAYFKLCRDRKHVFILMTSILDNRSYD